MLCPFADPVTVYHLTNILTAVISHQNTNTMSQAISKRTDKDSCIFEGYMSLSMGLTFQIKFAFVLSLGMYCVIELLIFKLF